MTIGANKEEGDYDAYSRLFFNLVRFTSYTYSVVVFYNVLVCGESLRKHWKIVIVLILSIINAFFSGQRSSAIGLIIAFLVAAKICLYYKDKLERNRLMKKFRKKLVNLSIIILALFFLSASAVKNRENETQFADYMTYYFGSTTALMGRIVEKPYICHTPFRGYFGEKTFMGFWDFMYNSGFVKKKHCDREWINMGDVKIPERAGNEYTFFCAPYIDFGFGGTLIFIAFFYWMFSYLYYKKIYGHKMSNEIIAKIAIYIFLYVMVCMSFYQDTIRTYTRPINLLYLVYIYCISKYIFKFGKTKEAKTSTLNLEQASKKH
jgi:oligosaccharide repeat unit polymerase